MFEALLGGNFKDVDAAVSVEGGDATVFFEGVLTGRELDETARLETG